MARVMFIAPVRGVVALQGAATAHGRKTERLSSQQGTRPSDHATAVPVNRSKRTVPDRKTSAEAAAAPNAPQPPFPPRGHPDSAAEQFKQNLNSTRAVQALQYAERAGEWTCHELEPVADRQIVAL